MAFFRQLPLKNFFQIFALKNNLEYAKFGKMSFPGASDITEEIERCFSFVAEKLVLCKTTQNRSHLQTQLYPNTSETENRAFF